MSLTTRITRLGNSKGIIIPSEVIKALSLEEGDPVELVYHPETETLAARFPGTKQLNLIAKTK
jgi:antitoxin component of MazEF toxin-antitoxin module